MGRTFRKLSRHGHALHVAIAPHLLARLRWRAGDYLVTDVNEHDQLVIRRATPADLVADWPSLQLPDESAKVAP